MLVSNKVDNLQAVHAGVWGLPKRWRLDPKFDLRAAAAQKEKSRPFVFRLLPEDGLLLLLVIPTSYLM